MEWGDTSEDTMELAGAGDETEAWVKKEGHRRGGKCSWMAGRGWKVRRKVSSKGNGVLEPERANDRR